ncbi:MAG: thioredoxin family protein [Bacteroidota bacterium]
MRTEVKILCPWSKCGRCRRMVSRVREAERISGRNTIITIVDSMDEISTFNTWILPTLVINNQVVARGYAPSLKQIIALFDSINQVEE